MKGYVDLYVLPIPKKNLEAYQKIANKFANIVREHGALEYREWVGDDLNHKGMTGFPSKIKVKPGEILISSVVEFKSKAHRDQVNKKIMNDERMKEMINMKPLFEMKRMMYGGFATIVQMKKAK